MMNVHLAKFLKDVVNHEDMPKLDDDRITKLFDRYDQQNNCYLERDGFVKFYITSTLDPGMREAVWKNLKTMGVRKDLKTVRITIKISFSNFLVCRTLPDLQH